MEKATRHRQLGHEAYIHGGQATMPGERRLLARLFRLQGSKAWGAWGETIELGCSGHEIPNSL